MAWTACAHLLNFRINTDNNFFRLLGFHLSNYIQVVTFVRITFILIQKELSKIGGYLFVYTHTYVADL